MGAYPEGTVELFCSYSRKDALLQQQFGKHTAILRRNKWITIWTDRDIGAGDEWAGDIDSHLETAQIIVLLVSSDFMDSEYCYTKEMARAMARHDAGEAEVIPVIVRPCLWEEAPFAKLQALPPQGRPVTSWPNQDEAWTEVTIGLKLAVKETLEKSREKQAIALAGAGVYSFTDIAERSKIPAGKQADAMKRWEILQETQTKIFEIQTDVMAHRKRSIDESYKKWDKYIQES